MGNKKSDIIVSKLKKTIDVLCKETGEKYANDYNPCEFFHKEHCLMKVFMYPQNQLDEYICWCDNPNICTPYKEFWFEEQFYKLDKLNDKEYNDLLEIIDRF